MTFYEYSKGLEKVHGLCMLARQEYTTDRTCVRTWVYADGTAEERFTAWIDEDNGIVTSIIDGMFTMFIINMINGESKQL